MLFDDTYKTIKDTCTGIYKEKGSKFIAIAIPVSKESEIKEHLIRIKKQHPTARHHCYAYRLGADKLVFRANDDGEPSGTAGKPILGQIISNDLTNVLIVAVRYFGGTLLGTSGLIQAYKESAADALKNAEIITLTVNEMYEIKFLYPEINEVMKLLKEYEASVNSMDSGEKQVIQFTIRKNNSGKIFELLKKISNLDIQFLKTY